MAIKPVLKLDTVELLFNAAVGLGLDPTWLVPDGLFVVSTAYGERYINRARSTLNSHVSSSLAKNKYLTRLILERNGMPNIPFIHPKNLKEATAFLSIHKKIVVKPLKGEGAQDIHIITKPNDLAKFDIKLYILEKYVVGKEMRYLILNNQVIAVHESEYGISVAEDRPLERISYSPQDWNAVLMTLSLQIAGLFDLRFAAVDYLIDDSGNAYVLELNTSPGLKWFHAPSAGPSVDVASMFMQAMISR